MLRRFVARKAAAKRARLEALEAAGDGARAGPPGPDGEIVGAPARRAHASCLLDTRVHAPRAGGACSAVVGCLSYVVPSGTHQCSNV